MKKKSRTRSIDTVFVLIIFSTFAFSVLMVLMLGAGVYRNINDMTREAENERTALSYIRTKMRNSDNAGAVRVAPFEGISEQNITALHIDETIGGTEYRTVIYEYDGWLCEIFGEAALGVAAWDGMRIAPVHNLRFEEHSGGVVVAYAGDMFIVLSPRSGTQLQRGIEGIAAPARNDTEIGGAE